MKLESADLQLINKAVNKIVNDINSKHKYENSSACYCQLQTIGLSGYKLKLNENPYYIEISVIEMNYKKGMQEIDVINIINKMLSYKYNNKNYFELKNNYIR